jgi:hypothetical protein
MGSNRAGWIVKVFACFKIVSFSPWRCSWCMLPSVQDDSFGFGPLLIYCSDRFLIGSSQSMTRARQIWLLNPKNKMQYVTSVCIVVLRLPNQLGNAPPEAYNLLPLNTPVPSVRENSSRPAATHPRDLQWDGLRCRTEGRCRSASCRLL